MSVSFLDRNVYKGNVLHDPDHRGLNGEAPGVAVLLLRLLSFSKVAGDVVIHDAI